MAKNTRAARTAAFINANPHLDMNECCLEMVANGMFRNNTEARDWFRYVVRQGHAQGQIIKGPRVKSTGANRFSVTVEQQEVNETAMAQAQATVGEPEDDYDPTAPETLKQRKAPETLKQRKARQARERRAAKKAQQVHA